MAQASISAISPSPYGCSLLPARGAWAAGISGLSGLECSSSGSNFRSSNCVGVAESKLSSSNFIGSWEKWGTRLDGQKARVFGEGPNYSFHKGTLQPACSKMFVPGFGEKSPEAKAADSLHNFFTFVAVKIVLSQLQDYNREGYEDLMDFVDRVSLKDGDKFCATLLRESHRHKGLAVPEDPTTPTLSDMVAFRFFKFNQALRIMEVRSAYAKGDFEWDNLQRLCTKNMEETNTRLMRDFLVETSEYEK